jgi:lysyl-tRNA synthetase class 2
VVVVRGNNDMGSDRSSAGKEAGEDSTDESAPAQPSAPKEEEQVAVRRAKLHELREQGNAFPNDFRPTARCGELATQFAEHDGEQVEAASGSYRIGGRVVSLRSFGKSVFMHVADATGRLQVYAQKQALTAEEFEVVRRLDVGDIVAVEGGLFRTKTAELSIRAQRFRLLVKSLRPLPEKWHGLTDVELRLRQRYVDLIVNEDVRETFRRRTAVVAGIRSFLHDRGFMEVETPMMQRIAGGAAARPFVTHHNALSLDMYLRIAPELYLKRLVVGGFERVFELNRNFRNEGVSTEHNPEFTMCEFYQAYATYEDLMALTEELFAALAREVCGTTRVPYGDLELSFEAPFARMTMAEAVAAHSRLEVAEAEDPEALWSFADELGIDPSKRKPGLGLLADVFDIVAEQHLDQPTFITSFPVEVSPLARPSDSKPGFVDRFELFVAGREIANGFSELNDPEIQHQRFLEQLDQRAAGDDEAHVMDEDYVRALEYGMPPTAGEGIGVDRLVMLLTDSPSIREVILFPHLKPERSG